MKPKSENQSRLEQTRAKWLRADHSANMAHAVLEAAQQRMREGDDGSALLLLDAAKCVLDRYVVG